MRAMENFYIHIICVIMLSYVYRIKSYRYCTRNNVNISDIKSFWWEQKRIETF